MAPRPLPNPGDAMVDSAGLPTRGWYDYFKLRDMVKADVAAEVLSPGAGIVTATATDVTGLTLPPGDWEVWFFAYFDAGATTSVNSLLASISLVSGALDGALDRLVSQAFGAGTVLGNSFSTVLKVGPARITVAASTPMYGVVRADFTVSTMNAFGRLVARPYLG